MAYTRRYLEQACRAVLEARRVLVLTGARQTGKTTLVRHLLSERPERERLILDLDDPFLRDRLVGTERSLEHEIERQSGRPFAAVERFHLALDEAQKAPALFERIKALPDSHGDRIHIVLTGSSALEIHDPVAESLAGRARLLVLPPMMLSEAFAHRRGEDPTVGDLPALVSRLLSGRFDGSDFDAFVARARWDGEDRRHFADTHLLHPLFPEPCTDPSPERWIRDYLATYLEKDVQILAAVGNVALFRACLRQVAARTGSTVKWETMAQEIGTTSVTLRKYVGLMDQTLNLVRLEPFTRNPVGRVTRAPKVYLTDPGVLWGLRGFEDPEILAATGMIGHYMEAAVVVEVAKWCSLEPTLPEPAFWRKTAVSEVDLVVSNRGYHIPFEVKAGAELDPRWLRGLDAFERDHGPLAMRIPYRILVHRGEPQRPDDRTFVLPLWAFC